MGLKPKDIWDMSLWEYNAYVNGYEIREKNAQANCILVGYYAGYYINASRKTKSPNELIKNLFNEKPSYDEAMKQIEIIKQIEKENKKRG